MPPPSVIEVPREDQSHLEKPPPSVMEVPREDQSHLDNPPPSVIVVSNDDQSHLDIPPPTPAVSPPRTDLLVEIVGDSPTVPRLKAKNIEELLGRRSNVPDSLPENIQDVFDDDDCDDGEANNQVVPRQATLLGVDDSDSMVVQQQHPQQTIIQDTIQVHVQRNVITHNPNFGQQVQYNVSQMSGNHD